MLRLRCRAQNYAWGRLAEDSEVARLCEANGTPVDGSKPYAELWIGTHPSGPSELADCGATLREWIDGRPEALGDDVAARFGAGALPFLFKVLSVRTALSIQSHPDKTLAEKLHVERPTVYKDPNHKPEMAIALTDFEALCSFVSNGELAEALTSCPELRHCVGDKQVDALLQGASIEKEALKGAFTALMMCAPDVVSESVTQLCARLEAEAGNRPLTKKERLVLRLNEQYPKDVGVLASYFLNQERLWSAWRPPTTSCALA
eukprot:evm.model.scf_18.10 EVM.evm.TU.scf_18.10   scf_18:66555-69588(-)